MSHTQRALQRGDMNLHSRIDRGVTSADHDYIARLISKVWNGGRVSNEEGVRAARLLGLPDHEGPRGAAWMNGGANARVCARRVAMVIANCISRANGGVAVDPRRVLDEGLRLGERLAVQDGVAALEAKRAEGDQRRDKYFNIDQQARAAEKAKQTAMNDDAQRYRTVERIVNEKMGARPLYAPERREGVAQLLERNNEQRREYDVRTASPDRRPDRSDDRRDLLSLNWDSAVLTEAADDELTLRDNPYLEAVDTALVNEDIASRENE